MKNIYKDEVIGNINSNLIYNNEIKGVFGSVSTNWISPEKELWSSEYIPTFITNTSISYVTGDNAGILREDVSNIDSLDISLNFSNPTYVNSIKVVFEMVKSEFRLLGPSYAISTTIANLPIDRRNMSAPSGWYFHENIVNTTVYDEIMLQITNENEFKFDFSTPSKTITSRVRQLWSLVSDSIGSGLGTWGGLNFNNFISYYPTKIMVTLIGTELMSTENPFQYGSTENAYEQPKSTLLTASATYKGRPLWEHIGQRIVNQWENGKQVVSLPTIINSEEDIKEVNEETYIFNVRRGEIDENNPNQVNNASIFKTLDGTAKKFIIVNITNNYDGSMNQMLDLQEVIE